MAQNITAKIIFIFPQRSKLGIIVNSNIFIMIITKIWRIAFNLDFQPDIIHIAISISAKPMHKVIGFAYS